MGSWDFMYPRGYRPRTRSGGRHPHKKNLCLECKADIGTPTIGGPGGRKVQLRYCQKHYCARILANGTICSDKNNGRSAYCDHREFPVPCRPVNVLLSALVGQEYHITRTI